MRAQNNNQFAQYLIQICNWTKSYIEDDFINSPKEIVTVCDDTETSKLHLINIIFPCLIENVVYSNYMTQLEILSTKMKYVDYLNNKLIRLSLGKSEEFVNSDEAIDDRNQFY